MNEPVKTIKRNSFISSLDPNVKRLVIVLLVIFLFACFARPSAFLKLSNFQSISKQLSEYGLMALGIGLTMISGGIDLSTVYIANLSGIAAALFMQRFSPETTGGEQFAIIVIACLLALVIGALCGAFNGFLVAFINVPAMLATLGTYQLFYGIAIILSKGSTVSGIPKSFSGLGNGMLFGFVPYAFVVFFIVVIILSLIMKRTKYGIYVQLVGTNIKSSFFSGIKVKDVLIKTYLLSGLVSAMAGLISLSRLNSAKADFGSSYTMQCILIVVLGGINPNGGFGSIPGIAIGVVILQTLSSLLNMFPNISNFYRDLLWGGSLIVILIVNYYINANNYKRRLHNS